MPKTRDVIPYDIKNAQESQILHHLNTSLCPPETFKAFLVSYVGTINKSPWWLVLIELLLSECNDWLDLAKKSS